MVLPALLGALGTLGAGFLGADAASDAAAYNYQIDLLNYYARERERFDAIQASKEQQRRTDRQEKEHKLGTTDAQGTRTRFVEGVGWVTELGDEIGQLQDLYQDGELAQLVNDLPKRREVFNRNVQRQREEAGTADALMGAFRRIERGDDREIENQLNQASTRGITQGFDETLEEAMRTSLRTGSAPGAIAAKLGKARADALTEAFQNNKINARGQATEEFERNQANIGNLYNMFATRASSMPDAQYNPRNIEGMSAQEMAGARSALAGAQGNQMGSGNALINAFAKMGGTLNPIEPNYGWANALQSGSTALSQAFQGMVDERARASALGGYGQYSGVNPSMYQRSTGAW